jgi:hypothetical protein
MTDPGMTPPGSKRTAAIRTAWIAPCGMNCRLCYAFSRDKNTCPGCRGDDSLKMKSVLACRIKNCQKVLSAQVDYCFECDGFPCARLRQLDRRYRTKYGMSMIQNLQNIREFGLRRFTRNERDRWTCRRCGEVICVHKPHCRSCQLRWR